jgi:hypothetical protein
LAKGDLRASNAALSKGGTAADGSFLLPSATDPSIPALAVIEASARKLTQDVSSSDKTVEAEAVEADAKNVL